MIYIYDQKHELDNHMRPFPALDCELLLELQQMIKSVNPYAHKYLQITDLMKEHPIGNIRMVLRSPTKKVNPRRYNLPLGTEVTVIMPSDAHEAASKRDVVVYRSPEENPEGHSLMTINTIHSMYDLLKYVLMFLFGDKGYSPDPHPLTKKPSDCCIAMQYYKYRLMP